MAGGKHRAKRGSMGRALSLLATIGLLATTVLLAPSAASAAVTGHRAATASRVHVWHVPRLTKLVAMARKMTKMHIPYSHGGHGRRPATIGQSVDCSGLVRQLYRYAFGVDIGGGSGDSMVRTSGLFVKTSHPVPGDVILVGSGGHAPAYHSMIYVGNDGGHATGVGSPTWGETVKYQHPRTRYWAGDVMGYWHYKGATKQDSAKNLKRPSVKVKLWSARSGNGTLNVTGYAFDPVNPGRSVLVDVYASGHRIAKVRANKPSPGVNKSHHITGRHRLSVRIPVRAGAHPTRLLALHIAGDRVANAWSVQGHATVRSRTVAVIRTVKTGTRGKHGTLRVTGFGYDALNRNIAPRVRILVDGRVATTVRTNISSPGVNKYRHLKGKHRFGVTINVGPGHHTVRVRTLAINRYSVVGHSRTVRSGFVKRLIRGHFDSLTAHGKTITVSAWALRPYYTKGRVAVAISLDGKRMAPRLTRTYRADINKGFHVTGQHGLNRTYTVAPGTHRVCLRPRSMSYATFGASLGCKTVVVRK